MTLFFIAKVPYLSFAHMENGADNFMNM